MAHHQHWNHDPETMHGTKTASPMKNLPTAVDVPSAAEDELAAEADEPPDGHIQFKKIPPSRDVRAASEAGFAKTLPFRSDRKHSLLTQALMVSPEIMPLEETATHTACDWPRGMSNASNHSNASAASTADLTSDGSLTSPARTGTPSPPLPPSSYTHLKDIHGKLDMLPPALIPQDGHNSQKLHHAPTLVTLGEGTVEAGLGRRRCITFACGRKSSPPTQSDSNIATDPSTMAQGKPAEPPRRPCMLRFACTTKPSQQAAPKPEVRRTARLQSPPPPAAKPSPATPKHRNHRDSESTITATPRSISHSPSASRSRKAAAVLNDEELDRSEATRFHEFASSVGEDDEWVNEQTVHRRRITVHDTLSKEYAIRQLGQEAEEEALEEEDESRSDHGNEDDEEGEDQDEHDDNGDGEDDDDGEEEDVSDGGNETDDEEGFAQSDDESDGGSEYQFWTSGATTAATSTDQVEHFRQKPRRNASESSIESILHSGQAAPRDGQSPHRSRKTVRARKSAVKLRPGTPDLPDRTDFVCGTLDEDRPLEAAYLSCLEVRKRSKHAIVPQDIDPSFPVSDPEDEDDADAVGEASDEHLWIKGQLDNYDDAALRGRTKTSTTGSGGPGTPNPSPKRLHSPPPRKRAGVHRSPPPRRLFGHSPKRLRSPPPTRHLRSPPGTLRSSVVASPEDDDEHEHEHEGMRVTQLAQRPHLTHTKSLPRNPNPMWNDSSDATRSTLPSRASSAMRGGEAGSEFHRRGPIDIVAGLEKKRQRRKEKFWRQQARQAGKEKERKPPPGKGAERMRELGLEMAGRGKTHGYVKRADLVLSI